MLHGCKLLLWLWLFMSFSISVSLTGLTKNQFKTHFWGTYRKGFAFFCFRFVPTFTKKLLNISEMKFYLQQYLYPRTGNLDTFLLWVSVDCRYTIASFFEIFLISLKIILIILFFQCSYFRHYNVSNSFVVVVLG